MATLQKTFHYEADASNAPINQIGLDFDIPTFEYSLIPVDLPIYKIQRNLLENQSVKSFQDLTKNNYIDNIPNQYLMSYDDESIISFWEYLINSQFKFKRGSNIQPNDNSEILSYNIPIQFSDGIGNVFGNSDLETIISIAISTDKFRQIATDPQRQPSAETLRKLYLKRMNYVKENLILINKIVFIEFVNKARLLGGNINESEVHSIVLGLISLLTEIADKGPKIINIRENFPVFVIEFLQKFGLKPDEITALKVVFEQFKETLLDFPILVPEIEATKVAGTLKINSQEPQTLSNFRFYNLAIDYLIEMPNGNLKPTTINFDFNSIEAIDIQNNTINFEFPPLIRNFIESPIMVSVKGFDGSVLFNKNFSAENTELSHLAIEVDSLKPAIPTITNNNTNTVNGTRLNGKVVELTGNCSLKDLTILVQAKEVNESNPFKVVGVATTDGSGNFSMPYPIGNFISAQAIVSLTPNSPVPVNIYTDEPHILAKHTISDDFLFLLIEADCKPKEIHEDDCDCHSTKKSSRLPDQAQLISSDEYTQDIGGSCINLTTPNRTLSEYAYQAIVRTSDPDVANYTLEKIKIIDGNEEKIVFNLTGGQTKVFRKPVDIGNPILWQDAPDNHENLSIYQAVTVATGHLLHYKTVMKADGYSMGDLLYSLPLAPGQKKQIVIFDQTHTLQASETQQISQAESLASSLVNDRNITDSLSGNITESLRGSSSATTKGISAGLGLAGTYKMISGVLGVSGGYAKSNSSASQDSARNVQQHFQELMRNSITQNAQSYREMNASVITTVQEGQSYGVTAEVIANHNHCHSLTMMYFEVLRHYAIYQELSSVEECLFVPLLMTNFTTENIYKWRDVLATNLLPMPSQTYLQPFAKMRIGLQHPFLKAFDANERIKTNYENVDFPENRYCDEPITSIQGYLTLKVNIPRPKTFFDRILSFPIVKRESITNTNGGGIWGSIVDAVVGENNVNKTWEEKVKIANEHIIIYDNFQEERPANVIEVVKFDNFFISGSVDEKLWTDISNLCGFNNIIDFLSNYFSNKTISQWDRTFYDEIAPKVFEELVKNSISISPFTTIDFTTNYKYHGGERLMRLNLRADSFATRASINTIKFNYTKPIINPNDFWEFITLNIENVSIGYTTKHYSGSILNRFLGDDLQDGTLDIQTPLNSDEQRNPRKEDKLIVRKFIEHLNSNLEYYNRTLWLNLDEDRRFMLLDGFNIQTNDEFGQPSFFRSLASVVKNELISIVGNSLVLPVAPGYKVDRLLIAEVPTNIEGEIIEPKSVDLFEHYKPLTPVPPYRISVPTRGVFAEAVQGACDACEKVKDNTSQDWEKFKTDEPTSINPVTVPVPTVTDWKAAFKDFATPIVNIQNAPTVPAPGAGLAGLSELLGKSDIFKDVTGLTENQKNVMATYLSNQENAKAFAQMAKEMSMQAHNTQNSDNIAESIRNSPEFSDEKKAELLEKHINQKIDGGQSLKAEQEQNAPSPIKSGAEAASKGQPVIMSKSDNAGNTESANINTTSFKGRSIVDLSINTSEERTFNPKSNDKTGLTNLKALISTYPETESKINAHKWEEKGAIRRLNILSENQSITNVQGIKPGKTRVRFTIFDKSNSILDGDEIDVFVPQYVYVAEGTAVYTTINTTVTDPHRFDSVLTGFKLLLDKQNIFQIVKDVTESLLAKINVRIIWATLGENPLSPFITPANSQVVTILGYPTLAHPSSIGFTEINPSNNPVEIATEITSIYIGQLETNPDFNIILNLYNSLLNISSPNTQQKAEIARVKDLWLSVVGRIMGYSIAHEIVHALIGFDGSLDTTGHTNPPLIDLLSPKLTYEQIGLKVTSLANFPADANSYIIQGLTTLIPLDQSTLTIIQKNFPVL